MVLESKTLEDKARELLADRGVSLQDIGELVMFLQKDYIEGITLEMCIESVNAVLSKREVHNTILTGVQLDILAEENQLLHPLQEIVKEDEGLYGIDEILALSIDKVKPGILKELNKHDGPRVHTFLDDIVGAIAASAASRLAHQHPSKSHYITQ